MSQTAGGDFLSVQETTPSISLGEGAKKKHKKKLTNVSLYVCMSAENSKMLVFFYVFFPTVVIYRLFQWSLGKKNIKMLVFMEYVCM